MSDAGIIDQLQSDLAQRAGELGFASVGFADAGDDPRMAQRLSVLQLRKLENLRAQEGERAIPLSIAEFLERVRRVDDGEVLEVAASSAAVCAFARG